LGPILAAPSRERVVAQCGLDLGAIEAPREKLVDGEASLLKKIPHE
jgi:hypothetical protein